MSKIVGIGANVYDTLITIPFYPIEDTKLESKTIKESGGGPCATGLVAASKLGESCAYIGVLSDDKGGQFLKEDFKKYHVSTEYINVKSGYTSFSSYILLSEKTTSRTCVFNKGNLPKLLLNETQKTTIENAEILMVDGNDLYAAIEGAKIAREHGVKVLYDAGGLYDGIEYLLPYANILIPSEEFAISHTKENNAEDAAKKLYELYHPEVVVITKGKEGCILYDGEKVFVYSTFPVKVIDSNGAGDVFHGAFAFAVTKGYGYNQSCIFSNAVSSIKCTKLGARESVPTYAETMKFLKERGINEL